MEGRTYLRVDKMSHRGGFAPITTVHFILFAWTVENYLYINSDMKFNYKFIHIYDRHESMCTLAKLLFFDNDNGKLCADIL